MLVPRIKEPFHGAPLLRIIVYWSLYWGAHLLWKLCGFQDGSVPTLDLLFKIGWLSRMKTPVWLMSVNFGKSSMNFHCFYVRVEILIPI